MAYQIQQPAIPNADDKWTAAEHHGNLLIFFPTEIRRGIKTSNGDADAVSCSRVVNLDTGRVLHNTLIFGTALVPNIGGGAPDGVVLGRLGQGEGKPGQSKPWILQPHDEAELRRCQEWLALDAQGRVGQPQAQAAPPTQNAYGAPATGGWGQQAAPAPSPAPATGGWGQPQGAPPAAPQQGGWGAPAPAAPSPAPAAGGWGSPSPAPAVAAPAPVAPALAPTATSNVHPELVAALARKGVTLPPGSSQQDAESIWGYVANNPDVA